MNLVNLNQMIFYVQYEHMMGSSGLIGFLRILKGWKRKATQDYEQFWELARSRLDTRTCQRCRHADGRYFGLNQ